MGLHITPSGASCAATIGGVKLHEPLSLDLIAELRAQWLEHKVLIFPKQQLTPSQLVEFSQQFGEIGEDPFFGHIDEHPKVAAVQRDADEKTAIFAEIFHSDWSFLALPPAGTVLYGITIPPTGGETLFADQMMAYQQLPDDLRDRVEGLVAIHSAALGYAPDGAYGKDDQALGRSMKILPSERARDTQAHPLIRTHHENGSKALFSSAAYITGFEGMAREESEALLMSLYAHQTQPQFIYSHRWEAGMVVMWDNRSLLHAATGGYDGHDRLLYRTTIADTQF
jgi:taurine dioxygenase